MSGISFLANVYCHEPAFGRFKSGEIGVEKVLLEILYLLALYIDIIIMLPIFFVVQCAFISTFIQLPVTKIKC